MLLRPVARSDYSAISAICTAAYDMVTERASRSNAPSSRPLINRAAPGKREISVVERGHRRVIPVSRPGTERHSNQFSGFDSGQASIFERADRDIGSGDCSMIVSAAAFFDVVT
jgi:hypothetical protein